MPPFSAAPRRVGNSLSVQFRDFTGRAKSMFGVVSAAASGAQVSAVVVAAGNMSNARVLEQRVCSFEVQISNSNPLNTTFDEAYATIKDEIVFLFQSDTTGEIRDFRIPAPDAILFAPDGETVLTPDGAATAGSGPELLDNFITAVLAALGAGFSYARAYKNNAESQGRAPLPIAEPTGNPGDAPGL